MMSLLTVRAGGMKDLRTWLQLFRPGQVVAKQREHAQFIASVAALKKGFSPVVFFQLAAFINEHPALFPNDNITAQRALRVLDEIKEPK